LRYIFTLGTYPSVQKIRVARHEICLDVYSWRDVLTVNEVFFRKDYPVSGDELVIVDFGSNIGLSAAYFLTAATNSFCYLVEPVPTNIPRLRQNLAGFDFRCRLERAAVALHEGDEEFGLEESGRYGGIGVKTGLFITVPCFNAIKLLRTLSTSMVQLTF
jgi:FkbM family methyltransferase